MSFKGKRGGITHNRTLDVNPGFRYIGQFRGNIQWYMMNTKDFISSISFLLQIQNDNLASFNGQSITFRLPIREV